jgi:hypothetical protein
VAMDVFEIRKEHRYDPGANFRQSVPVEFGQPQLWIGCSSGFRHRVRACARGYHGCQPHGDERLSGAVYLYRYLGEKLHEISLFQSTFGGN